MIRVNDSQHIAVTGDLLLRSIPWLGFFVDQAVKLAWRNGNTFDTVRGPAL
jgi:hypothetical protein